MKKTFSNFLFVMLIFLGSLLLVACGNEGKLQEMSIGKYYANDNTESYIEVLPENKILFVNIDFSSWNESMTEEIPPETLGFEYYDLAEKFDGQPQEYEILQDSAREGYDYTILIEAYSNEDKTYGNGLLIYYSKSDKTLSCLDVIYKFQSQFDDALT